VHSQYRSVPNLLPAHQLTRYHLDAPRAICEEILKQAPNVVEARIEVRFDNNPWLRAGEIIDVPSLCRLYVSEPSILCYIRVPGLQEIALWTEDGWGPDLFRCMDSLLVRSRGSLRRLCLKGLPDAFTVAEILRNVPSITDLRIIASGVGVKLSFTALMHNLTITDVAGSTPIAPYCPPPMLHVLRVRQPQRLRHRRRCVSRDGQIPVEVSGVRASRGCASHTFLGESW
jgi:hypothetical protein